MFIKRDADNVTLHAIPEGETVYPCPFCGSDDIQLRNTHAAYYWVECQGCRALVHGEPYEADHSESAHKMAALSAIKAWNTRAKRDRHKAPLNPDPSNLTG